MVSVMSCDNFFSLTVWQQIHPHSILCSGRFQGVTKNLFFLLSFIFFTEFHFPFVVSLCFVNKTVKHGFLHHPFISTSFPTHFFTLFFVIPKLFLHFAAELHILDFFNFLFLKNCLCLVLVYFFIENCFRRQPAFFSTKL